MDNQELKELEESLAYHSRTLEENQKLLKSKYSEIKSLPEFQEYEQILALRNESRLRVEQAKKYLKDAKISQRIEVLKASGFEARTGHTTGSSGHRDWQSDDGEPWTFVICPNSCPKIVHISESSRATWITWVTKNGNVTQEDTQLIGFGKTEQEAWEDASLADEEDIEQALKNSKIENSSKVTEEDS